MTRPSNYLCGKPANRNHSNGDRLREAHLDAYPDQRPWLDRPLARMIALVAVCLLVIGVARLGMAVVNDIALDRIEMGVD